ncbi:MAG: ATP-binding protein, partial [Halobacteriales archaeon]|nr:ATP-binding protein [Halobacteriales archaeon]
VTWTSSPGLWIERVHPDDRERLLLARTEAVSDGTDLRAEYRLRGVGDQVVWVQDRARVEVRDGRPVAIHGVLLDVTTKRESGVVLEELFEAQVRETGKLRGLQEEHALLLQVLAHDVRQPLGILSGIVETLKTHARELDHARTEQLLERAERAVSRTTSLLEQVMDHERLRSQDGFVRREWVDLRRLVRSTLAEVDVGQRSVVIDGDAHVWVDPMIVERAVANLLGNAAKHTPEDSQVRVRIRTENTACVLTIEDDGPGIPDGVEEQIFEPFVRAAPKSVDGAGLGLALVRRLAHMHDGHAWAERLPHGGAAFHLKIPHEPGPESSSVQR